MKRRIFISSLILIQWIVLILRKESPEITGKIVSSGIFPVIEETLL